ncbi:MAG TPA: DUF1015 domain-containing protein [Candidatus Binatia bacterium]
MVMLRPFRPLRYNPAVVGDLSTVVAPPYDVISSAHRDALHERSQRNVVHLILNRAADPYGTAARLLEAWRREGVLVRDTKPALCFYVEDFVLPNGQARQREGIIGTVRLEPFASRQIRPHERTFARAKEDRMRLLRACRTNLSPLFGLFADQLDVLQLARNSAATRPPDIDIRDDGDVRHRVWLLNASDGIDAISAALSEEPVVIADGHHRYETALAYAEAQRAQGSNDPEAPYNFVLMYLTSMSHPGLVILPTHRVLPAGTSLDAGKFVTELQRHFQLVRFPRSAREAFRACLRESPQQGRFGITLAGQDERIVAILNDNAVVDRYASQFAPVVRQLDVTVLDRVILRGLLGIDCTAAAQEGRLTYTHDEVAALTAVDQGAQAAFLMNPPNIADVEAVCSAGETMPEKSTYFFPKLLTGLVFYPFDE